MTANLFPSPPWPALPVQGETGRYPIHRIFCVGKNYAAHAAEMGGEVNREQPIFFTKSALAFLPSGMDSNYPPGTSDYQYEVELCVMVGKPLFKASEAEAAQAVYGYAVGLDMTRRDLQAYAKDHRNPWDMAKDVEESAIIGPVKHLIRQISREELRDVVDNARAKAQPGRRAVTEFLAQL